MAFGVTVYISLDIGLGITTLIGGVSNPPESLRSISLFILTSIWPALWVFVDFFFISNGVNKSESFIYNRTALLYFLIMSYIVLQVLKETRPLWYYILAATLFVLSQLAWFLLNRVICKVKTFDFTTWHEIADFSFFFSFVGLWFESGWFFRSYFARDGSCRCFVLGLESNNGR